MSGKLYISMYHYTRDLRNSRYPDIKGLDIRLFRQQMEYFNEYFNVISMEQVIDTIINKGEFPNNALLLTFDDGYIDNYLFALPILEEYGFQGSFFIPGKTIKEHKLLDVNKIHFILASSKIDSLISDLRKEMDYFRGTEYYYPSNEELYNEYALTERFDDADVIFVKRMLQTALPEEVRHKISSKLFNKYIGINEDAFARELYMSEDQIRTMKRHGMFIGIHGYDHYWLADIDKSQMQMDIDSALDVLDEFVDSKKWVMNYPYGSYNNDVIEYVVQKGACIGLTTNVEIANIHRDNPLTLPRFDCNDFPPKSKKYLKYE